MTSQESFLALAAPKCDLPGEHMIPRPLFPVNSAPTKYMREDKVPVCDRHHLRMRLGQASFCLRSFLSVHRMAVSVTTGVNTGIST